MPDAAPAPTPTVWASPFQPNYDSADDSPRVVELACPSCATSGRVKAVSPDGADVVTDCPLCGGDGHLGVYYPGISACGMSFSDWVGSYGRFDSVNYKEAILSVPEVDLSPVKNGLDAVQTCTLLVVVVSCAILGAVVFSHFWGGLSNV